MYYKKGSELKLSKELQVASGSSHPSSKMDYCDNRGRFSVSELLFGVWQGELSSTQAYKMKIKMYVCVQAHICTYVYLCAQQGVKT